MWAQAPGIQCTKLVDVAALGAGLAKPQAFESLNLDGSCLFDRGAVVDNALTIVAWRGYDSVARFLLDRGAAVNQTRKDGATALFMASQCGHEGLRSNAASR